MSWIKEAYFSAHYPELAASRECRQREVKIKAGTWKACLIVDCDGIKALIFRKIKIYENKMEKHSLYLLSNEIKCSQMFTKKEMVL